jgi:hypothetical protein
VASRIIPGFLAEKPLRAGKSRVHIPKIFNPGLGVTLVRTASLSSSLTFGRRHGGDGLPMRSHRTRLSLGVCRF